MVEKINRKLIRVANQILVGILSLLGFSSCSKEVLVEYGSPQASFEVLGKVTDSKENGLKGIRVTIPYAGYLNRIDTLYTKENGNFEYTHYGFPVNNTLDIYFEDISENARFETDSIQVSFLGSKFKGGDKKWNIGIATKEVTVKLKDKESE